MSTLSGFADRWVMVSGASSGIGRAISIELAAQGARVVLIGRNAERLAETAALAGSPERTTVLPLDLAVLDGVGPAIGALILRLGPVYGLCHAAGIAKTLPLSASRADRVRAVMDINLLAGLELARAVSRRDAMTAGEGCLLWLSSVYSQVGAPGQIAYCASKGAVVAAAKAMAIELAPRKIRVNTLSPGFVSTEMTDGGHSSLSQEQWGAIIARHPLGAGTAQDVARAAVFLLDPRNRWITGTDLVIDGGYTSQ